jgi:predicted phage terminase large subunit-like protein
MPTFDFQWYHVSMCNALQEVAEGKNDKLIIQLGPRRGKTELVWRQFIAWYIGQHPEREILAASYAELLSAKNTRDVKKILASPTYQEVFPEVAIMGKNSSLEFELSGGGSYRAAGVGQGIGGFGANLLVCDDLFTGRAEAESEVNRNKVYDWMTDDAINRVVFPGAIVLMFTRWHRDDAIGRILSSPERDEWKVLSFPAILRHEDQRGPDDPREIGECILPGMKPKARRALVEAMTRELGREPTESELLDRRVDMELEALLAKEKRGPYGFAALQQCEPFVRGGGMFREDAWQTYENAPDSIERGADAVLISVDATFRKTKRSDYVSITVWAKRKASLYLLDEIHRKMDYPETKRAIKQMKARWPRAGVLIEAKANGDALIAELRREIPRVMGFDPGKDSKDARAQLAAERVEARQVFLPRETYCPWILEWKNELQFFPGWPNDDRVDSFSQVVHYWDAGSDGIAHLRRIVGG